ncbi:MAG: hypothetical protein OEV49_16980 [candidate division Zixibacteria bacterium]|nr:hypothetical protein [candidate division Zixibacteria bacterium]MDH3936623.1 hypothetical protein [candidate division Zixibacteria bacterium]MDH4034767.1 hypothetical protein [candidate division Zixibacteria bacterium]
MPRSFVTTLFVMLILGTIMTSSGSAEDILLKKEILQGWKYSTDSGDTYQEVGTSGSTLRLLMSGSSRADYEMEQYAKKKSIARATGYVGAGLLGVMLVASAIEDWHDDYHWFIVGAVGVGFVSTIYAVSAKNHLMEAVRVYNRDQKKGITIEVCLNPAVARQSFGAGTFVRMRF